MISILKEFEKPFAKNEGHLELAGAYEGIPIEYVKDPSEYYFGKLNDHYTDEKIVLLDCPCLIIGCWSFLTKIEENNKHVIWKDFEQTHRNNWDYSNLESFIFDKAQYENALAELRKGN